MSFWMLHYCITEYDYTFLNDIVSDMISADNKQAFFVILFMHDSFPIVYTYLSLLHYGATEECLGRFVCVLIQE